MTVLSAADSATPRHAPDQAQPAGGSSQEKAAREAGRSSLVRETLDALHKATSAATPTRALGEPTKPAPDAPHAATLPAASSAAAAGAEPSGAAGCARRVLPACASAATKAWALARLLGANTLGALTGVLDWMRPFGDPSDTFDFFDDDRSPGPPTTDAAHAGASAAHAGASAVQSQSEPLWDLFAWLEKSQDKNQYDAWLRINGVVEVPDGAVQPAQTIAWEIGEARRAGTPVTLQDYNVPLLHPFAHSDDEIFHAYLQHMSKDGTYGSGVEARALADALEVRIVVYQPVAHDNARPTAEQGVVYGAADAAHTLHIRHNGGAHWEGVRRPEGAPDALALGADDEILATRGDGNCLFHAVAAALHATQHPVAKDVKHDHLRALAIAQMRDHAALYVPHVRIEIDTARMALGVQADQVDTRAVQAVCRAHLHLPWDATWAYLVARLAEVQSFNGAQTPNATSRAMDRLLGNMLQRLGQVVQAQGMTPDSFCERLTALGAPANLSLERQLSALSPRQRAYLLDVFAPTAGCTLAHAEATYGPLFTCLSLSDKLRLIGPQETNKLVARMLGSPNDRQEGLPALVCELDATLLDLALQRPLSDAQWTAIASDPAVLQGALDALGELAATPTLGHPAHWQALFRLVNAAPADLRDNLLQTLLRDTPQAFARLGHVVNRRITGTTPRDIGNLRANQAAIDVLFDCIARSGPKAGPSAMSQNSPAP